MRAVCFAALLVLAAPGFGFAAETGPPPINASFDCATAKSRIQHLICSDADLAALDVREEQLLHRAQMKAVAPDAVNADQNVWIGQRNSCSTVACLSRTYRRRIHELHAWTN